MVVYEGKSYEEISERAAQIVASELIVKPNAVLGLATGSSPVGMYKQLVKWNQEGKIDFSGVISTRNIRRAPTGWSLTPTRRAGNTMNCFPALDGRIYRCWDLAETGTSASMSRTQNSVRGRTAYVWQRAQSRQMRGFSTLRRMCRQRRIPWESRVFWRRGKYL